MKLTVSCRGFVSAAKRAIQVRRVADTVPWAKTTLIEARGTGMVRVSAVNVDGGAREVVSGAEVAAAGRCAISTDFLDRLSAVLPDDGELSLEANDNNLLASAGRVKQRVPLTDPELFSWPDYKPGDWFDVSAADLRDTSRALLWAAANDPGRPHLAGLNLTHDVSEATNVHVLARVSPGILPPGVKAMVPVDSWPRFRVFAESPGVSDLKASVDENRFWLKSRTWVMYQRLLPVDPSFTSFGRVIYEPDGHGVHSVEASPGRLMSFLVHSIEVNRDELLSSVRHVAAAALTSEEKESGAAARFIFDDGLLHVKSYYPVNVLTRGLEVDESIHHQPLSFEDWDQRPFSSLSAFSFSAQYLVKALSSMDSDVIKMSWGESVSGGSAPSLQFFGGRVSTVIGPRRL